MCNSNGCEVFFLVNTTHLVLDDEKQSPVLLLHSSRLLRASWSRLLANLGLFDCSVMLRSSAYNLVWIGGGITFTTSLIGRRK